MEQRRKPPRPDVIQKFLEGTATPEERDILEQWYISMDHSNVEWPSNDPATEEADVKERLWQLIHQDLLSQKEKESGEKSMAPIKLSFFSIRRGLVAAVILLSVGLGIYVYRNGHSSAKPDSTLISKAATEDVAPGGIKATLTLADGRIVPLDSTAAGAVATQGRTRIVQKTGGQLVYETGGRGESKSNSSLYNTITTPAGGTYQIRLPDGTKVWMNAVSTLRFPAAFTGKERTVELTGEAYFEVAWKKNMPFSVRVHDMKVEVLGTHFDIMAYDDEKTATTTLLEGSVRIGNGAVTRILNPGEQAQLHADGSLDVTPADTEEAIAWINGNFQFRRDDITTVMRQLARWYDVDVTYEGEKTTHSFTGVIARNNNASDVLKALEVSDVHFKIEGKKIIVLP